MSSLTLESITNSFRDGVYTTLLDYGVEPGQAYEILDNPIEFLDGDDYAEAEATDADYLG